MNSGTIEKNEMKTPSDAFVKSIDIHKLLPQQEPFIMIGSMRHFDMEQTISEFTISSDTLFVSGGRLTSSGIIENIAQTCAVRIGFINKYVLQKGIQLGFIGAINDFELYSLPCVGDTITTEILIVEEVFGMLLVTATVKKGDELLAKTKMKIAIKDENTKSK